MPVGEIFYSTAVIAGDSISARRPHPIQSRTAAALAQQLTAATGPTPLLSKSHSRALLAVAGARPPVTALGIDIEWMAPQRPFALILRGYLPSAPATIEPAAFYRTWTFLEAHYKAHQAWPDADDIRQVLDTAERDVPWRTSSGTYLWQQRILDEFQLTLLWRSETVCEVKRVQVNQA
jgi:hypothetical protein